MLAATHSKVAPPDFAVSKALCALTLSTLAELSASLPQGWALATTGGLSRGELAPGSDLDLFLLHPKRVKSELVSETAATLWYPLWDAGVTVTPLTHSVESALDAGRADLQTGTALLDLHCIGGDSTIVNDLRERWRDQWTKHGRQSLLDLAESVEARHRKAGEVAFLLEPDVKDGRGGLRDLHCLRWAVATGHEATSALGTLPFHEAEAAGNVLLATRIELHRATRRAGDRLLLQEQDTVAARLGFGDADALMRSVAVSARTISWVSDRFWIEVRRTLDDGSRSRSSVPVAPGFVARGAFLSLSDDVVVDSALPLRAGAIAAHNGLTIETGALAAMAANVPPIDRWTVDHRQALVSLLGAGHSTLPVIDDLDRFGLVVHAVPEWASVQSKPQRNAFHRFTVDRHLGETAAQATALVRRVARPDLLLLGAWLHDIGKGFPGDHTEVGEVVIATIGERMGFDADDVAVLVRLCRHHLLLAETATRRDLSDPGTIRSVADALGDVDFADLLHALTIADSLATGPSAWSDWKARLVADLVERVSAVLSGHQPPVVATDSWVRHQQLIERATITGGVEIDVGAMDGGLQQIAIAATNRVGLLRDVAGVLSIHGVEVVSVDAWTSAAGFAIDELRVSRRLGGETNWARVHADLRLATAGHLDLAAKIRDRSLRYASSMRHLTADDARAEVLIDRSTSATATIVEVRAPDGIGVLWRLTGVLADEGFDIATAKIVTLGHEVVDAFYVVRPGFDGPPDIPEPTIARLLDAATAR